MRLFGSPRGRAAAFAEIDRPPEQTSWRQARWCALDLELTGLDPRRDHIIAIGAVPIEDGRVILHQSAYTLVRTTRRSELGAVLVHKLRVADLAHAPRIGEAIDVVFDLMAGRVPVFHTAAVERAFLGRLFSRRRVRLPEAADTEVLGRRLMSERNGDAPPFLPLAALCRALDVPAETPHHALGDALSTAEAFVAVASHLEATRPQTVGSLLSARSAPRRLG
jgi:DNA polymerase III subunit epsilon